MACVILHRHEALDLTCSRGLPGHKSLNTKKRVGRKVSSKKPSHVDVHVGKRLRLRRNLLDLSQDQLARQLGLTAHLIQKYEVGETRISASRLYDVATQLAVPIMWLFEELDQRPAASAWLPLQRRRIGPTSLQRESHASCSNCISAYPTSAYEEKYCRSPNPCRHERPSRVKVTGDNRSRRSQHNELNSRAQQFIGAATPVSDLLEPNGHLSYAGRDVSMPWYTIRLSASSAVPTTMMSSRHGVSRHR
jgi:transcriptional regulator with XRE-family HTH domain